MTMPTWFAWFLVAWGIGAIAVVVAMVRQLNRPDLSDAQALVRASFVAWLWFSVLVAAVILGAP